MLQNISHSPTLPAPPPTPIYHDLNTSVDEDFTDLVPEVVNPTHQNEFFFNPVDTSAPTDVFYHVFLLPITTSNHIPKYCAPAVAEQFALLFSAVVDNPSDLCHYARLFMFPKCVLGKVAYAARQGPKHQCQLSAKQRQKQQIFSCMTQWKNGEYDKQQLWESVTNCPQLLPVILDPITSKIKRCKQLVAEGRLRDAIKSLSSNGVQDLSAEVLQSLQDKHPDSQLPTVASDFISPLQACATENQVLQASLTFSKGSGCSNDGFRADYFHDIHAIVTPDIRAKFFTAFTAFQNICLSISVPRSLAIYFALALFHLLRKMAAPGQLQ